MTPVSSTIGSLSNDEGDVNENGKKAIGLYQQNNNFARDHAFLYRADKGETSAPLFIQCVMRSRTGTNALSVLPVRLKAGEIFLFANRKPFFLSVISGYNIK